MAQFIFGAADDLLFHEFGICSDCVPPVFSFGRYAPTVSRVRSNSISAQQFEQHAAFRFDICFRRGLLLTLPVLPRTSAASSDLHKESLQACSHPFRDLDTSLLDDYVATLIGFFREECLLVRCGACVSVQDSVPARYSMLAGGLR